MAKYMSFKIDAEKWAEDILDGYKYRNKTIRQWADLIASDIYIDRLKLMEYVIQKMTSLSKEIGIAEPFPEDYVIKSAQLDIYLDILDYLKGVDEGEKEKDQNDSNC